MKKWPLLAQMLSTLVGLLIIVATAQAAQVKLAWDANTPAPEGYRIFQRPDGGTYNYSAPAWTGTATQCTVSGLGPGTHYFVSRAYNGQEQSSNSNEVMAIIEAPTPTPTPIPAPEPTPASLCVPAVEGVYAVGAFDVAVTLRAVDPAYQGNVKSKVFHKKGCRYFDCADCSAKYTTREAAIADGYRPCGTCKP